MTIKGTLETFNLRELLQMLSFNQKVGTLVLDTERGRQTVYVDKGRVTFVQGDPDADRALLRVLHRQGLVPPDRMQRALKIHQSTGRYLGTVLTELGAAETEDLQLAGRIATEERFLTLQLTSVSHFEFIDGSSVAPDGSEADPIEPPLVVDSLLLDLTRKMDQWAELARVVPGLGEVYEITGVEYDLSERMGESEVDVGLADRVISSFDGFRTLQQVVDVSLADELTVVEVTGALVETGALHAVPTPDLLGRGEDLLARGEARQALPLLRRAVEREDGPSEARLRLADALEGTGDKEAAACELDTYVALSENAQPRDIFDALYRALVLREGDPSTAARLCDHYLRNRPWLEERQEQAVDALRHLIHGAVTTRRPLDAAQRLAQYIHNGDSPSEDLLVLADLYASGGERTEAATALFRRSEDLLAAGRIAQGRELLERTVQLDPSRADARSRLHSMMGQDRRKRRHRRFLVFVVLMGLLMLGAGAAWWAYNQEANRALRAAREKAERVVDVAESKAYDLIDAFENDLQGALEGSAPPQGLAKAARVMLEGVREALREADAAIYEFAEELDNYPSTSRSDAHSLMLRKLEMRRTKVEHRANELVDGARARGRTALIEGEDAHRKGQFLEAADLLQTARRLSFDDSTIASRATTILQHVEDYIARFEGANAKVEAARERGDIDTAYRLSAALLREMLDSDLTRTLRLPVRIVTDPAGAEVRLDGQPAGPRTPCVLDYSPFGATALSVWLPGRAPGRFELPSFATITDDASAWAEWEPRVDVALAPGAAWRIDASVGPFVDLWDASGVPVLLPEDGDAIQTVDLAAERAGMRVTVRQPNEVRAGGTFHGNVEWRILGNRTLLIRAPDGEAWETQVLGHLDRHPVLHGSTVIAVDEKGTVYGLHVKTGEECWRQELGSPPCQRPRLSSVGVLVATYGGGVFVLDPTSGARKDLAIDTRGLTYAVAFGAEALVIGGTTAEIRRIDADGAVTVVGKAEPSKRGYPWTCPQGVAWIEEDGVRWLAVGAEGPVDVAGLGEKIVHLSGDGNVLYGAGEDGVVRAVSLTAPEHTLWATDIGDSIGAPPLPTGSFLLVLVDGGMAAVAR